MSEPKLGHTKKVGPPKEFSLNNLAEPAFQLQKELLDLLGQIANGDQASFKLFYEKTISRVHSIVRRFIRVELDVEEVVSETYIKIWYKPNDYEESRASILGWVLLIARSKSIDFIRKERAHATRVERMQAEKTDELEFAPEYWLMATSNSRILHEALGQLSEIQRQLLALSFFRNYSHQALSELLDLPLGTVKSHIRRAIMLLSERISSND